MTQARPLLEPIQMFWGGGELSRLERLSMASFIANGHPVRLFHYESLGAVPDGVELCDAATIVPESDFFRSRNGIGYGSVAPFSNRFRYKLLAERGGVWSDTDVVALKPLAFLDSADCFFASEFGMPQAESGVLSTVVASCLFKVPPRSAVMDECLTRSMTIDPHRAEWGATGVQALRDTVAKLGLTQHVMRPQVICPVPFWDIAKLLSGMHTVPAEAHAIHFYSEMFRRNFFDKNANYEPLCVFERLKAHYLKESR